jgi:hypothetical protein
MTWMSVCKYCQWAFVSPVDRDQHEKHCAFRQMTMAERVRVFRRRKQRFASADDKGVSA